MVTGFTAQKGGIVRSDHDGRSAGPGAPGPMSRRGFLGVAAGAAVLGTGRSFTRRGPRSLRETPTVPPARTVVETRKVVRTGPPPITVTVPAHDTAPGVILLTPVKSHDYEHGPLIVDNEGNVIWFRSLLQEGINLQMQTYNGQPVLTWWKGKIASGHGLGVYEIINSNFDKVATVRAANGLSGDLHEFVISPEGTALFTLYEKRGADLSSVGGPTNGEFFDCLVQEVDIATGRLLMQWRASKHVRLEESYEGYQAGTPFDFFHINSIDIDSDKNLLVSSRNTWCVYKIERTTGEVIWRLHGKKSDFAMGAGTEFQWQHHARHHADDVLTLFDDGAGPVIETPSRGLKMFLNMGKMRAELVQEYLPRPRMVATSQGSVQVLPNGNVFIGWGSEPYFSEYTADGKLLYEARLPTGINSYRAFRSPWTATPPTPT
jgi:hypothetical protein